MTEQLRQYRMLVEYQGEGNARPRCANPLWEFTQGRYRSEAAVRKAYKARAKSLDFKILAVEPWEN
jgi:hypothetical protein